ncbi:uncharacterized protein LOC133302871 [Gastrolobium bilobum]|uniref:uncharacterized protein LOC133302871 n=1 Tax=Gastrolobium bilobum TaxID=150636 RepID=UPI002AB3111A|nr:uncharacterized protein LOC133302871 [Gastrolobium bilobum]
MPTYVKFMKEILSRKRRLEEFETVALTQESSQYLLSKIPPKLGDPGSFTIPCTVGDHYIGRALYDLGVSINLMPLNYEEDREVPIILGRAFLATGGAVIDVKEGELAMNVNGDQVKFNISKAMKYTRDIEECSRLDIIDYVVKEIFLQETSLDSMGVSGCEGLELSHTNSDEAVKWLNSKSELVWKNKNFESLELAKRGLKIPKPSIEEPLVLELKPLPNHLRYAYLGEKDTLPVIVSNLLTVLEEEQLLAVLKNFKRAIGWSLADIKGILF